MLLLARSVAITKKPYRSTCNKNNVSLQLKARVNANMRLVAYKFKNDKSNTLAVLLDILTSASEIHSYNTRYASNQNFFKPSVCTNYGTSTFKFSATKIWESVPLEFKCSPYMLFKKQYKRFLLSTQN